MQTLIILFFSVVGLWVWSVIVGMYDEEEMKEEFETKKTKEVHNEIDFSTAEGIFTVT